MKKPTQRDGRFYFAAITFAAARFVFGLIRAYGSRPDLGLLWLACASFLRLLYCAVNSTATDIVFVRDRRHECGAIDHRDGSA